MHFKTKINRTYTKIFGLYCAVNTLRFGYKNQSVSDIWGNSRCFFWDPYRTHKYTAWTERI